MADESASTEVPESESFAEEIATDSDERYPQIEGLSDNVTLSYTQIGSDDPIIGLVIADLLPDIHAKDLDITNVQAYIDDEEVVPYGDVTFSMDVDPDSQVVLYKLDENGKIASEQLEVTDGTVSYQTSKCGRWLIISSNLESETETETMESESETASNKVNNTTGRGNTPLPVVCNNQTLKITHWTSKTTFVSINKTILIPHAFCSYLIQVGILFPDS